MSTASRRAASTLRETTAPTLDQIAEIAEEVMRRLPEPIFVHTRDVIVRVEDFPSDEIMEMMELETPFDLLGLYHGVDLPARSVQDVGRLPDLVYLYRRPILDEWCESGSTLAHIVQHVLIHEIGHHFGFTDADMEALEDNADEED